MHIPCKYETATARQMALLTDSLLAACERLEKDLAKIPADPTEAMVYCHNHIVPDMAKARAAADELEGITAGEAWPFPVYSELLFSV